MGGYSGVMGQPWGVLEVFYRYKWEKGEQWVGVGGVLKVEGTMEKEKEKPETGL